MIAPPKRPANDELEALIKEARERQRRRRVLAGATVAGLAASVLAVHALATGGNASRATAHAPGAPTPSCAPSSLLAGLVDMSSPTGLGRVALKFSNRTASPCRLDGYPVIRLADGRGTIPFRYAHRGTPQQVELRAGGAAFAVLAKFRCDLGTSRSTTQLTVVSGGAVQHLALPSGPSLCKPGIPAEGRTVLVYPFAPTLRIASETSLAEN